MGLRLSEEKTRVCHIDEGFDFLGWRIQRRRWKGRNGKRAVYTYPSKKSLLSVMAKVRSITRRAQASNARRPAAPVEPGAAGMVQLLPSRRVSTDFRLPRLFRLLAGRGLAPQTTHRTELGNPATPPPPELGDTRRPHRDVPATDNRHRAIPLPGHPNPHTMDERDNRITRTSGMTPWRAGCGESRTSGSEGGPEKPIDRKTTGRSGPTPTPTCAPAKAGSTWPPSSICTREG